MENSKSKQDYNFVIVESYLEKDYGGPLDEIKIRPIEGENPFMPYMAVECPATLSRDFVEGTLFKIKAKIVDEQGGKPYIKSDIDWPFEILRTE